MAPNEAVIETRGEPDCKILLGEIGRGESRVGEHPSLQVAKDVIKWVISEHGDPHRYVIQVRLTEEDGAYCIESPMLPGAVSQGATESEAIERMKTATAELLRSYADCGEDVPWVSDIEAAQNDDVSERWIIVSA